jgi:hypothetical protein
MPTEHVLKVAVPYFDALLDGSKTFEVRRNDRSYQRGDTLVLWDVGLDGRNCPPDCPDPKCYKRGRMIRKTVSYVYAGDPRFGGLEPGHVVLALGPSDAER